MDPRVPVADSPAGPILDRFVAALIVGLAVFFVIVLASVSPDPRGHGTHEQLGLEPCGWPIQYGIPCVTCGVTTSACYLVHLAPVQAFVTQPFGATLTLAGLWTAWIALSALIRRQSIVARLAILPHAKLFVAGLVLLLMSWGYLLVTWPD